MDESYTPEVPTETHSLGETKGKVSPTQELVTPEILTLPGNNTPFMVVKGPHNSQTVVSLEKFLDKPLQQVTNVALASIDSFTRYVNEYKRPQTKIFHNTNKFEVVFDYYKPGDTSKHSEEAHMPLDLSDKFSRWTQHAGHAFGQEDFAKFLDDNLSDIQTPDASKMLKSIQNIEGTTKASFVSKVDIDSGSTELTYEEQTEAKAKGKISLPSEFKIVIPIYECSDTFYALNGKIRPKIHKDGRVTFSYHLQNLEESKKAALAAIAAEVAEKTDIVSFQTVNNE